MQTQSAVFLLHGADNELPEKGGFIRRTSNGGPRLPQGSLPWPGGAAVKGAGAESWCSLVTGKALCTERAGREMGRGGWGGHARSEFRHVYITAQDISQSSAKLPKFPGSGVLKRGTGIHFSSLPHSSHLLPPAPLLWGLSRSSTPFASS